MSCIKEKIHTVVQELATSLQGFRALCPIYIKLFRYQNILVLDYVALITCKTLLHPI